MEVTQFTYFQQSADRLQADLRARSPTGWNGSRCYLQGVDNVYTCLDRADYGDVYKQNERAEQPTTSTSDVEFLLPPSRAH